MNPLYICLKGKKQTPLLILSLVTLALLFQGCAVENNERITSLENGRPNIVYIMADDLGYGDLSSYNDTPIHTPNLDRLADEGMRFTQHYSGSTVCAPSRSVLMTGLHTGHTPIRGNLEYFPIGQHPLPYGIVTVGEILQQAGYTTGGFGKWGLGFPGSEGLPSLQGFDHFFGYLGQRRSHFYYPEFIFRDVKGKELEEVILEGNEVIDDPDRHPGSGQPIVAAQFAPDVINSEALKFIEDNKDGPFFLYVPSLIPHASLEVPENEMAPYLDEGNSIFEETPFPEGEHYSPQPFPKATYAAMVSRLDRHVGEILDKLDEEGLSDNTIVIFTSDNGSYSEGGYHYTMLNSNANLRGGKRDLYEGGIRVPAIIKWPGKISAGTTSDHITGAVDMMATFSELAGTKPPPNNDGISIVPELLGMGNQTAHDYMYWEFHEEGGKQAVRKGKWKAVRLGVREDKFSPIELYNLEEDLSEQNNIADSHPDIIEEMEQILKQAHVPSMDFDLFKSAEGQGDWLKN
ncbi:MAG: arylsulfatase [Balneolales bacterium]